MDGCKSQGSSHPVTQARKKEEEEKKKKKKKKKKNKLEYDSGTSLLRFVGLNTLKQTKLLRMQVPAWMKRSMGRGAMARTFVRASSLHPTSAKSTPVWLAGCLEIVDKRSFQRPRRAKEAQHKLGRGHVTRGRNN
ncbi:hypothetical protein ACO22_05824 [Paracoccidioides brasiliensis]|uniref:Uncharacterized protein n=1 Tax=Paracoccidioides brasiliensis TaxID=121759 RepID=A0A1D2J970_PARBR|nr:hypothetical protein ACO22_05824 [Paracoccidioides brasiliensis]